MMEGAIPDLCRRIAPPSGHQLGARGNSRLRMTGIFIDHRPAVWIEFRVHAAGPDVHRVMRVLVEEAEGGVVDAAAAKIAEVVEAENLRHVAGGRLMGWDGVSVFFPRWFGRVGHW